MKEMIKVSILIPVYNRSDIIEETIQSALNQTYENIEVIIVDNCSEDDTYIKCKEFEKNDSRVNVFRNKKNLGPVKNWQECLRISTGEYIKFLWSDDWMDLDFIEKTIPFLEDDSVAFAYSPAYIVMDDKNILSYNLYKENKIYDASLFEYMSLFGGNVPVSPGCAVFRRNDVQKNLLIDIPNNDDLVFNTYGAGNDLLIYLLTLRNYSKVAYVCTTKSYFRAHKGSFSISNKLNIYYDWAKLYYLKIKNQKGLLRKFKSVLLVKRLRGANYNNIYSSNKTNPDINFLIYKSIKKVLRF